MKRLFNKEKHTNLKEYLRYKSNKKYKYKLLKDIIKKIMFR